MKKVAGKSGGEAARLIDERIKELNDWRGAILAQVRGLIKEADPEVVETWKWRGVPIWEHDGIVCTGESYQNHVKLTFMNGAKLKDPKKLFNAGLDSRVRRAIDFHEGDKVNAAAFKSLIREATAFNSNRRTKSVK